MSKSKNSPDTKPQQIIIKGTTAFVGPHFIRRDNVDILVEEGRISKIESNLPISEAHVIDGANFFVTPGFINGHFHPSQQLNRALAIGVPHADQMDLLHATDKIKESNSKYWLSLVAILEALKAGTTCFYSVGSEIESQIKAYKTMGLRAACTMIPKDIEATDKPSAIRATTWSTADRIHTAEKLHNQYHGDLVRVHFGVCNDRYASDELIKGMVALSEKYKVGFHMHIAEGDAYVNEVIKRTGHRSVEHLDYLHALNPRVSLAHATKLNDHEIGLIAESGASIVHCPRANAYLAVGTCPVSKLLSAGVNICLGSDAATNNNSNEVRGEAKAAYMNLANHHEQADIVDYVTLFQMLTINGARAMGLSHEIGTLDEGKKADFVMWSKNDLPFIPGNNYIADLIFTDSCRAHTVFVNGEKVLDNYRATLIDEDELIVKARELSANYLRSFEKEVKKHLNTGKF